MSGRISYLLQLFSIVICVSLCDLSAYCQPCDSITPSFVVDLSNNPDSAWISADTNRAGLCCGASNPDNCIEFLITLSPDAEAIIFDIWSGAVAGGALNYQIDCGPVTAAGDPICLVGVGPHRVTFCKPGGNDNEYVIYSIAKPSVSTNMAVNQGCTGTLFAYGYDVSTISWTSVFPDITGDYNSYLSCLFACDSTVATGGISPPPFVDYQVCGTPAGGCDSLLVVCDTVRVYFNTELFANILPVLPTMCFGDTSVTLIANGIGGTPPYSWLWSTGDTTQSINVDTGTYWIMVSDSSYPGCPPTYDTVVVTSFTSTITANAGADQSVCALNPDINLTGIVTGATGGIWSGGSGTFNPSPDSLSVIYTPSGTEIADSGVTLILSTTGNGSCPADSDSIFIIIHPPPIPDFTFNDDTICLGDTFCFTDLSVSPGGVITSWFWDFEGDTSSAQNPCNIPPSSDNDYDVKLTVADSNGCSATIEYELVILPPLTISVNNLDPVSCYNDCDGFIKVNINGGSIPDAGSYILWQLNGDTIRFSYLIPGDNDDQVGNLCAGTYIITLSDSSLCEDTTINVTVAAGSILIPNIVSTTNVSCNGSCDGAAVVAASGGTPSYGYSWSPSGSTSTGNDTLFTTALCAGTYVAYIQDDEDCDTTLTITITEPPVFSATISSVTNVSCNGDSSGSATVVPSGGTPPYTYLWVETSDTTATATGLPALDPYHVDITDSNGCTIQIEVVINEPAALVVSKSSTNVSCNGNGDGTAAVSASGGTPFYTYIWNTVPAQTTATVTGLVPGIYSVTVTDGNGCDTSLSVTITEPNQLIISVFNRINTSCNGGSDGAVSAIVVFGTSPYTYSWNTSPPQTNTTATGLSAGIVYLNATDNNGCTIFSSITIFQPPPITVATTVVNANCGNNDGQATVTASGGTPYTVGAAYLYFWNTTPIQTGVTATGLPVGAIDVIITDSNGCSVASIAVVSDLNVTIVLTDINNVGCFSGSNGSATVDASGSTPPYTYQWDPATGGQSSATATGLSVGSYSVTATDSNGCQTSMTVTVTQPLPIITSVSANDVGCNGESTGQANVVTSGESPPYTYLWSTNPTQTSAIATGLTGGVYSVTVTDFAGCDSTITVVIDDPPVLAISTSAAGVSCFGANDGSTAVTVIGGTPSYTYLWGDPQAQTTATASGLDSGVYTITVTDANGCDVMASVTITEPALLTISASSFNVNCNGACDGLGIVTVSGGIPVYSYAWNTVPPQSSATADSLCPGNYGISVVDNNGCTASANITITEPTLLTGSITSFDHVTCNGGNDGNAVVTPFGGTLPYIYSWNDLLIQTDSMASGLSAGTYIATVTDSNGCSISKTVTIIEPPLLTANISSSVDVSCNGVDDGQATVSALGGTPTYGYSWNTTPIQSTATADSLLPGTYTVTVTDVNGCDTVASISITEPALLTAVITDSSNVSCFGGSDGSATLTASGGTAPYTYLWNDSSAQSTVTAGGLSVGSYIVTVTDANGCDTMASTSITEPSLLTHSITLVVDVSCNGSCDGEATILPSGGTLPYTYVWCTTPFQSTNTATGLCQGNYCITVIDANGCMVSDTVVIIQPAVLTASLAPPVIHVKCKGGSDGEATVNASGGTAPYSYAWNDPATQSTATATGLTASSFTVVVTDSNNCSSTGNVTATINEPAQFLTIGIADSLNVSCNGGSDGEATAIASGGTPFYTYLWSILPSQFTASATGLSAGVYTVTVLDGNGCDTSTTATIGEPTVLIVNITDSVNVGCKDGNDGSATLTAGGGTSPYLYSWDTNPVQTNTVATGLAAGTYTATVSDTNNCSTSASVNITEPDSMLLFITEINANCGNPDGAASVVATGGTPPYSYLWSPGGITNDSITGIFSGIYTVIVTDSNGCTDSAIALVNDIVVFIIQDSTENLTCYGGADGTISITITSGTPPLTFDWSHDSVLNDSVATALSAGIYYLTVTDSNNCQATKLFSISGPVAILDSVYVQNVTCYSDSDGQVSVFAVGGTPPYTYLWGTVPVQTDSFATGLTAGSYNISITDTLGCDTTVTITITEPDSMIATITSVTNTSCIGSCDGTATVTGSGGNPPYGYSWQIGTGPVQTDSTATGLCAGTFPVILMDMNGCLAYADTSITEPDTLLASITNVVNVSCNGYSDGQATVTATGGTPGYSYLWATITPVQTDSTATGLEPITHTVTVTDTNGCSATASASITEPGVFAAILGSVTHGSCNGGFDGSASVVPFGGTTPYSYSWSTVPVQTDSIATGLSAGTDTVIVSDFNGCSDTVTAPINEPPLLTVSITDSNNVSCFGGSDGEATVTAVGGSGLYAYLWDDSDTQTTQTATGLSAGNYSVTVTDDNGCDTGVSVTITEPPMLTVSVTGSVNVSCKGGNDGSIWVLASGGTTPYAYSWDDDSVQTTDSAFALIAGIYTVTVTDTMGCETATTDTITEPALLAAVIPSVTNVSCKGDSTGSATVNVSGGTSPYTYLWDDPNAQTDTVAINLIAGTYNVIVTDFMGCDTTIIAIVTEPDSLILSIINITHVACYGDSTGEATAGVSGGTLPYIYLWNTPDTISQTDSIVTGLPAGTFAVTVTDTLGCIDNDSLIITEPSDILISVSNDTLICTGDNALISVFASGGSGSLNYTWSDTLLSGAGPFSVSPVDTTIYIVTVTDSLGCISKDSVKVKVGPVIIIFAIDDSICVGDSTTISAVVTGGDGNYSYLWETGATTNSITVNPTISTYYTLTVDDGCATPPETDSVFVEVNPYPVIGLLPPNASACESATITFIDVIADIPGSTYFWDFGDGSMDTTTNASVIYTYNNTGIFSVSVSVMSPQGCQTDSANVSTVVISALPTANFTGTLIDTAITQPTVDFTDLSFGDPIIGDTISSWYWDFGDGNISTLQHPVYAYADTGIYTVMLAIINEYGCPDTIIKTLVICSSQPLGGDSIVLSYLPAVSCTADPIVTTTEFPEINFTSTISPQYYWDFGDGDTANIKDPVHTYKDSGTYNTILTVTNIYGCVNTCSLDIVVNPYFEIKVPNAFTPDPNGPNGGVYDINIFDNNVFFPVTKFVDEFHMMIFNRWGELVFESFDLKIGWDGYYRDKLSQADAYVWKIELRFINGGEVKMVGDVTLIR